ncbi:MAG: MBL fold metallo-hydrolase [Acidobacteriota bacterium]|jgi:ribonuclease BN (tRNA processing enzyme)|nr:MBL fold metallo-hydrolase [Acidobacteriota bacterium]NLT33819.1 MBL fold metallo-hydrolase [Acidobacteriota bacterium]
MNGARVTILGSGDAFSAGGRLQSSALVQSPRATLLLDCGATILPALNRLGLSADRIDQVFVSHIHGDHFAGLPFLFLHYLYIEPRDRPLVIIGPPGVEARARTLFAAMYADTAAEPLPFRLDFIEMVPGERIRHQDTELAPIAVRHQDHSVSLGCDLAAGGRRIVYTGDTGWFDDLPAHTRGADLFLCECTFFDSRSDTHLDYARLREHRGGFGARRIVLTHLGQEMLDHAAEVELEMAHDGMVIDL